MILERGSVREVSRSARGSHVNEGAQCGKISWTLEICTVCTLTFELLTLGLNLDPSLNDLSVVSHGERDGSMCKSAIKRM